MSSLAASPPAPSDVRFEHHRTAFGIGEATPRLSWRMPGAVHGWEQTAYEVEVRDATGEVTEAVVVPSGESVLVPWPAAPLGSRDRRSVRVRVRGREGGSSPWSEPATVETGLLAPSDWTARMVSPVGHQGLAPVLMRRSFVLDGEVASARLYVTAHGLYEAQLNGRVVGDEVLAPGWTSYARRLRYQSHDVTDLVRAGENVIGATVADGWYRGRLAWPPGRRAVFGDRLGLLAQLEVRFTDGRTVVVGSDETWRWATGPVQAADLYDGEHHDATAERPGWGAPGSDDAGWGPVEAVDREPATLVAPEGPPVRRVQELAVAQVLTSPSGALLLDFGQNLVGRLRIRVQGPRGSVVRLRHAEVLHEGELALEPLRSAEATDSYTLSGDPAGEVWEPRFTFHGFRYAEVTGWPGTFDPADVTAVVVHSDLQRTGWFECSDPGLNRLHENVVWGMRGNVVDVPTDCPQRDERLGWTGDIQVFAPTASYLYDSAGFLSSWLQDLAADQDADGTVPVVVPDVHLETPFGDGKGGVAGWGDAAVIVPWVLYQRFGDLEVLRRQYDSMCRWVDGITASLGDGVLWDGPAFQLGDWLDPVAPPSAPWRAATDTTLVATAYRARVAQLLSDIAAVLGQDADAARFAELADRVRTRFHAEYVTRQGRVVSDSQTAYALALEFALLPDAAQRERAGARLVEVVRSHRHRIGTGFLGTPLICDALTSAGAVDDAYRLLLQTEAPSWLYAVTMGATTIWERWDSLLPDGSLNSSGMTSFNHYALGAVADWMHRVLGGLAPAAPGYRELDVAPQPGGGLEWATSAHLTPYGRAEVVWRRADGRLSVEVVVPTGSSAVVTLPDAGWTPVRVGPGRHVFECAFRRPDQDPAPESTEPLSL